MASWCKGRFWRYLVNKMKWKFNNIKQIWNKLFVGIQNLYTKTIQSSLWKSPITKNWTIKITYLYFYEKHKITYFPRKKSHIELNRSPTLQGPTYKRISNYSPSNFITLPPYNKWTLCIIQAIANDSKFRESGVQKKKD